MKTAPRTDRRIAAAVAAALVLPVLLASTVTAAAEVQLAGDIGVGYSDNLLRTPTNERSETITQLGLQFAVIEKSSRLAADLRGDFAYLDYAGNSFSSELIGNAGLAVKLGLVDENLSWSLDDIFGQTRRDPFAVVTPLNRENVNYFSTGPNAMIRLGGVDRLTANARYGRVNYQTDLYDTDRFSTMAGYEHDLSAVSHLGINISQERVDPQGTAASFLAYVRQEAYGRYSLDGARTKAILDVGGSRVDRSGLADNGLLVRLDVSRKLDDLSTINLRAGRQITDTGGALAWSGGTALPTAGLDTQSLARTVNPFTSTYAELGWQLAGRRTHIVFGGSVYDESYASTPQLDRKRYTASVHADRALTPRLTARAGLAYNKYDYSNIAASNDEQVFDLGLNWRVGRYLSLDLSAQKSSYSSQLFAGNVDETRIWLKVRYAANSASGR